MTRHLAFDTRIPDTAYLPTYLPTCLPARLRKHSPEECSSSRPTSPRASQIQHRILPLQGSVPDLAVPMLVPSGSRLLAPLFGTCATPHVAPRRHTGFSLGPPGLGRPSQRLLPWPKVCPNCRPWDRTSLVKSCQESVQHMKRLFQWQRRVLSPEKAAQSDILFDVADGVCT